MTGDEPAQYLRLRTIVPAAIVVWAVAFWFVYGPMVFAYLLMHAATTGVFLTAISLSDRRRSQRRAASQTIRVAAKPSIEHQTRPAKRAVAS